MKIIKWLDKNGELVLMSIAASIMIACVILQILTRYLMRPFSWTEEVARFSFVWLTFLGISYGIRNGLHIQFDVVWIFLNKLSPKVITIYKTFQYIIQIGLWLTILRFSITFIDFSKANKAPALGCSMLVRNLSVLVGSILCCIRLVQMVVMSIKELKENQREGGKECTSL